MKYLMKFNSQIATILILRKAQCMKSKTGSNTLRSPFAATGASKPFDLSSILFKQKNNLYSDLRNDLFG